MISSPAPAVAGGLAAALSGLGLGLSLIVAIGAQNAFVLQRGLLRRHVGPVVVVCAASDAVLITAGTAGAGAVVAHAGWLLQVIRWVGAAFLVGYGLLAARRACTPATLRAEATGRRESLAATLTTCLALTWLNPHVYLDTVLLVGSVAAGYGSRRWLFAAGAVTGSVLWFTALGFGARWLRPVFARPLAWRLLDAAIAVVMVTIAVSLVTG